MPGGVDVPDIGGGGGGGGAGSVGGIPTRYILIGAGVLGVGALLLWQSKSSASGQGQGFGAALGPNASLALGGLQTQVMQESGRLQELFGKQLDTLSSHLDVAATTLGDQGTQQQKQLFDYLNTLSASDADYATRLYMLLHGQTAAIGDQLNRVYQSTRQDRGPLPPAT